MFKLPIYALLAFFCFGYTNFVAAQGNYILNLNTLNGQKISKTNLHSFTILSNANKSELVKISGVIKMRSSRATIKYQYQTTLKPGINQMGDLARGVIYSFSSSSLEKLFKQHGALPNGEYEYCVDVFEQGGEALDALASDCIYDENQDLFLINLMDPEDKAKLSELYPMFSWTVNSPLINDLNYKIRVAEIKDGQVATNAVMRNRPVYEQGGLRIPNQNYPVTARSLEYFQPYAWTVDAYYRDILMGSAETWEFVIINDSLMEGVPKEISYLNIRKEKGGNQTYAIGKLKLSYNLLDYITDELQLMLFQGDKRIKLPKDEYILNKGTNRLEIDFSKKKGLKHLKLYRLEIKNNHGERFEILFKYINPDFL